MQDTVHHVELLLQSLVLEQLADHHHGVVRLQVPRPLLVALPPPLARRGLGPPAGRAAGASGAQHAPGATLCTMHATKARHAWVRRDGGTVTSVQVALERGAKPDAHGAVERVTVWRGRPPVAPCGGFFARLQRLGFRLERAADCEQLRAHPPRTHVHLGRHTHTRHRHGHPQHRAVSSPCARDPQVPRTSAHTGTSTGEPTEQNTRTRAPPAWS